MLRLKIDIHQFFCRIMRLCYEGKHFSLLAAISEANEFVLIGGRTALISIQT